jgi:hypothetical protein
LSNNNKPLSSSSSAASTTLKTAVTAPIITNNIHKQCVLDLMALLQAYGPLTVGQLEYNLPPHPQFWDVLQLLVALGLVKQVNEVSDKTTTTTTLAPRYCVCGGITRPTSDAPLLPQKVLEEIQQAHLEIQRSVGRRRKREQAILLGQPSTDGTASTTETSTAPSPIHSQGPSLKQLLKQLYQEYPEITRDPVYVTALKLCHVDTGSGEASVVRQSP